MPGSLTETLGWAETGTDLLTVQLASLDAAAYDEATLLPGWTRKHLIAHLAANADALCNLVHWARTGEKTPMYVSMDQRNADIEAGALLSADDLARWFAKAARNLSSAMEVLTTVQWQAEVVTAQGRTVPATEVPWMRAREVCIHAVDLGTGLTFADLPDGFLRSLKNEIMAKRAIEESPEGPLADVVAYLAGRAHSLSAVPDIGPWL